MTPHPYFIRFLNETVVSNVPHKQPLYLGHFTPFDYIDDPTVLVGEFVPHKRIRMFTRVFLFRCFLTFKVLVDVVGALVDVGDLTNDPDNGDNMIDFKLKDKK